MMGSLCRDCGRSIYWSRQRQRWFHHDAGHVPEPLVIAGGDDRVEHPSNLHAPTLEVAE